jgi:hypothetical protein
MDKVRLKFFKQMKEEQLEKDIIARVIAKTL